jgi:uncharacterized protein YjfI (DUF2170 family)
MTVLTGSQIEGARLLTLRQMLKLEMLGMSKSRGPTAYSTLKMMGFKGTREKVLSELNVIRAQLLGITQEGEAK